MTASSPLPGGEPVTRPRVTIVMAFHNAERFIDESLLSVAAQTLTGWELVVVDDGSVDGSSEIARRWCEQDPHRRRYTEHAGHAHLGLAASWELGVRQARADFVALLMPGDVWMPEKLAEQVDVLAANPGVALVQGRPMQWFSWDTGSAPSPADRVPPVKVLLEEPIDPPVALLPLLSESDTPCASDWLFRRDLVDDVGGLTTVLDGAAGCEEFALLAAVYLSRRILVMDDCWTWHRLEVDAFPAGRHRPHRAAISLGVDWLKLHLQSRGIRDRRVLSALRASERRRSDTRHAGEEDSPAGAGQAISVSHKTARRAVHLARRLAGTASVPALHDVRFGDLRRTSPVSQHWGWDRGQPVDRYYIERFVRQHSTDIRGRVLEIGDRRYTRRFGLTNVERSDVLHVDASNPRATILADLTQADHIPSDAFDCIILTQTLHLIYDVARAAQTLHRILAPGGVLLLTVPGITKTDAGWSESWHWSFNRASLTRLAADTFNERCFTIEQHGNILAAIAFLHGLAREELTEHELNVHDASYPVTLTLRAWKESTNPRHAVDGESPGR